MSDLTIFIIAIILTIILTPSVRGFSTVNVQLNKQEIVTNDTFVVYVNVTTETDISGMQTDMKFNKSIVKIDSVQEGDLFTQTGWTTYAYAGVINNTYGNVSTIFSLIIGPHSINKSGTFIKVYGTALQEGRSAIELDNVLIAKSDSTAEILIYVNGLVTVTHRHVPINIIGDVNNDGNITVADALLYLRYSVGQDISPYHMDTSNDVTCDGNMTVADALMVLRKSVGQDVNLSCQT